MTAIALSRNERPSISILMGKQYNKTEKKTRREAYIERKKVKVKAGLGKAKAVKKPAAKKKTEKVEKAAAE